MLLQTYVYPCIPRTGLFRTHKQQTIVLTDSRIKKINLKKLPVSISMLHSEIKIIFKWWLSWRVLGRVKLGLASASSLWAAEWWHCLFPSSDNLDIIIGNPLSAILSILSIGRINLSFPHFSTTTKKSTFLAPESQGGSVCHMTDLVKVYTTCYLWSF